MPVVAESPVAGSQLYVVAPEAVRATGVPPGLQNVPVVGVTPTVGFGFTVTVTNAESVKPELEQATTNLKYVVDVKALVVNVVFVAPTIAVKGPVALVELTHW